MKSRDEIITSMCLTWDHSYLAPEQEIFTNIKFGLSKEEKQALRNNMSQIFDNDIQPLLDDYQKIIDGESVVVPVSEEHANAMLLIATQYLEGKNK